MEHPYLSKWPTAVDGVVDPSSTGTGTKKEEAVITILIS